MDLLVLFFYIFFVVSNMTNDNKIMDFYSSKVCLIDGQTIFKYILVNSVYNNCILFE